ncbi:insulin-like growth factor 1 receptor [Saccostrea echinata]|nr:insulin-like growth factor 1 receptor [Saccostrea echinata]
MEFHLYGDLKTYLLSRRNLVGLECKEADEIRPERLTMMALDIACGLRYIHDLKYVHRDLACRNCLVHSSGRVKIGDFGMTRPIIESDYYRFTKKGMLPVRWMSPESLSDGLFTAKSDMWSYGVLLFEIVTFGSFPYQGLSNSQVVEYVKAGSRLMLPRQCPDELCTFIYSCLAYEPCDRPDTGDIIDQLLKQPDFLIPCLDAPATSVEDTEDAELLTSSQHNTITKANSFNLTTLLNRLSTASNDGKRLSGASQGGKVPSKYTIKTFVPAILGRPRSNSISSPHPSHKNHEYFEIHDESPSNTLDKSHRHSMEIQREHIHLDPSISLLDTYPPAGERTDTTSDYFSDNSKEIVQNLTFEFCQTITSL